MHHLAAKILWLIFIDTHYF